jgi:hypothetical protein
MINAILAGRLQQGCNFPVTLVSNNLTQQQHLPQTFQKYNRTDLENLSFAPMLDWRIPSKLESPIITLEFKHTGTGSERAKYGTSQLQQQSVKLPQTQF